MALYYYPRLDATNGRLVTDSQFDITFLPTTDEKDALAGTGTPSAANKYVTEDYAGLKNLVSYTFVFRGTPAQSVTDNEMFDATDLQTQRAVPGAGTLIRMVARSNTAITAGSLVFEPTIDGADTASAVLDLTLDSSNQYDTAFDATGIAVTAIQRIGAFLTSDATFAGGSDIILDLFFRIT